ncbi:hypothetical protein CBR_g23043 [Chara braunii]|uniref:Uncharacterized protein n=1 Tax=Chara braunii TaxID=69332 RepID=A0A388L3F6_CHABU|nr:hypothetical protein CBR_g23043 [Chara braunii]|eukprot:GBG76827.1 hypothetical protein CBR_g23043 [Chara braunii]
MIEQANKHKRPSQFAVGDLVWVKSKEFVPEENISQKLLPAYRGPWQVLDVIGDVDGPSYVIEIPLRLHMYPVFHASRLLPCVTNELFPSRRSAIPRSMDGKYDVDKIVVESTFQTGRRGRPQRQYKEEEKGKKGGGGGGGGGGEEERRRRRRGRRRKEEEEGEKKGGGEEERRRRRRRGGKEEEEDERRRRIGKEEEKEERKKKRKERGGGGCKTMATAASQAAMTRRASRRGSSMETTMGRSMKTGGLHDRSDDGRASDDGRLRDGSDDGLRNREYRIMENTSSVSLSGLCIVFSRVTRQHPVGIVIGKNSSKIVLSRLVVEGMYERAVDSTNDEAHAATTATTGADDKAGREGEMEEDGAGTMSSHRGNTTNDDQSTTDVQSIDGVRAPASGGIQFNEGAKGCVRGCMVIKHDLFGITVCEKASVKIKHCVSSNNGGPGIAIFGSGRCEIEGSRCESNKGHGVVMHCKPSRVARNVICGNGGHGIFLSTEHVFGPHQRFLSGKKDKMASTGVGKQHNTVRSSVEGVTREAGGNREGHLATSVSLDKCKDMSSGHPISMPISVVGGDEHMRTKTSETALTAGRDEGAVVRTSAELLDLEFIPSWPEHSQAYEESYPEIEVEECAVTKTPDEKRAAPVHQVSDRPVKRMTISIWKGGGEESEARVRREVVEAGDGEKGKRPISVWEDLGGEGSDKEGGNDEDTQVVSGGEKRVGQDLGKTQGGGTALVELSLDEDVEKQCTDSLSPSVEEVVRIVNADDEDLSKFPTRLDHVVASGKIKGEGVLPGLKASCVQEEKPRVEDDNEDDAAGHAREEVVVGKQ